MMLIDSYNLENLQVAAREEIQNLNVNKPLSSLTHLRLGKFLESYLQVSQNRSGSCYQGGFNLVFEESSGDLLSQFDRISRKTGISKGDILTIYMKEWSTRKISWTETQFSAASLRPFIISNSKYSIIQLDHFVISNQDLLELDDPVALIQIKDLIFDATVEEAVFLEKISRIVQCDVITLPSHFSKLSALSKIQMSGNITFRDIQP